ncbi:DUF2628 domain-containing protein [Levilactobacillus spicheri]|uniref:DUF2628 domain-containing protein n=2 Tax=Levilactobacillus spicheri TaxID=216463 RepID=A0A0F3RV18_9LACO|nr:DUF2628 domain-containing protein [Levilactobacillus spicheri]KJW13826.1 hypothetical protein VC81_01205 [Levilactobacillus spicheri]KRL47082.1 hypothetical protein FD37_GL000565 [Levilactobacillus spicheri DSM 15429]GEO67004.1 hypothetical protein LSP04_14230 [Levilactobacillus spicheri]
MQDPFKGFNDDDNNNNGNGPQGLPLPPNYATVVNPQTGNMRIAKVGFAWIAFIFPVIPPIFRGDWYNLLCIMGVNAGVQMIVQMSVSASSMVEVLGFIQLGLQFLWGAIYNMMYFKHLFNRGFVPADERSKDLLTRAHYWNPKNAAK